MRAWPIIASLLVASCAASWGPGLPATTPRRALVGPAGDTPRCMRLSGGRDGAHRLPLADAETDPQLVAYLRDVPPDVRRTVRAAGLEPALARLLRDRATGAATDVILARRQAIALHLQSLEVQLDATAFEVDCMDDLHETLRASLEQDGHAREIRWTVASLVIGAIGAIGAGVWQLADPDARGASIVGIAGGGAAATIGLVAFVRPGRQVVLEHERNLLAPIATGTDPGHIYPTFVFRLLTQPLADGSSPRAALRARFDELLTAGIATERRARAEALMFGGGGIYDAHVLALREQMLDELESAVGALARDLEILQRFLGRTLDEECLRGDRCAP